MSSTVYEARNEPAPRTFVGYAPINTNLSDLISEVLTKAWKDAILTEEGVTQIYRFQVLAEFGINDSDHSVTVYVWS